MNQRPQTAIRPVWGILAYAHDLKFFILGFDDTFEMRAILFRSNKILQETTYSVRSYLIARSYNSLTIKIHGKNYILYTMR